MFLSPINCYKTNFINFCGQKSKKVSDNSKQYPCDEFVRSTKSLKRGQILDCGEVYISTSTQFFRDDIDWNEFGKYLKERFKDFDKVNTYDYACSDGSEAYSLSMMMQHKFQNGAEKFFPIYAKDIDEDKIAENIENQKTGKTDKRPCLSTMANAIGASKDKMEDEFLITEMSPFNSRKVAAALKDKVVKPVIFSEANILDDIENIDDKNPSIVMCRNMWPYVDFREYPDFAETLYDRLKIGSMVVLGAFDCFFDGISEYDNQKISKALINAGFTPADTTVSNNKHNLIYEKN